MAITSNEVFKSNKTEEKQWFMDKEAKKWRNLAILITIVGIIVFTFNWETNSTKFYVGIPLYMMFVYVYYKYICLRKAARENSEEVAKNLQEQPQSNDKAKKTSK
jgi:L-asparagine transporter-like permease